MALGHPVFAPVQLDAGSSGAQQAAEQVPHLNGGVSLPPRGTRRSRGESGAEGDGGSSAAATDGSGTSHPWVSCRLLFFCVESYALVQPKEQGCVSK